MQTALDDKFILNLSSAQSNFGRDFLKINDANERMKAFAVCMSDLSSAVALSEYTSYKNDNSNIVLALNQLLKAMQDSDAHALQVMKDSNKIFLILKDIMIAPRDQGKTKALSDYVSSIYSSN